MQSLVVLLSGIILCIIFSCNGPSQNAATSNQDTTLKVALVSKTEYLADSSIRIEYQWDSLNKKKQGICKEYDATGLIKEYQYKQDVLDGVETLYFAGGEKIDGQFNYVDGVHQGAFSYFYESNGQAMQKGNYVDGKIEGLLTSYYEDGTLKEEINHVDGLTQGPFKEYNEAGILVAEGNFTSKGDNENLEDGLLKLYDENGALSKKMVCQKGQCCTSWTVEDGDVAPSNNLCKAIIESLKAKDAL